MDGMERQFVVQPSNTTVVKFFTTTPPFRVGSLSRPLMTIQFPVGQKRLARLAQPVLDSLRPPTNVLAQGSA